MINDCTVGNAAAYALDPLMVNFRLKEREKGMLVGSHECATGVAAITAITMPSVYPKLSQDWRQVLRDPDCKAYAQLRADLKQLGEEIDRRNNERSGRRFVSRDYHPDCCAISSFA